MFGLGILGAATLASSLFGGDGGRDDYVKAQRRAFEARERSINQGLAHINAQTDQFYTPEWQEARAQEVRDLYKPQLDQEYKTQRGNMTYGLADRGVSRSSIAAEGHAKVAGDYAKGLATMEQKAQRHVQNQLDNIERWRQGQINTLMQTGRADAVRKSAMAGAQLFNDQSHVEPWQQVMSDAGDFFGTSEVVRSYGKINDHLRGKSAKNYQYF